MCLGLMLVFILGGCNTSSKQDFVNTNNQLTFGTNVLTTGVAAQQINKPKALVIQEGLHIILNCDTIWKGYLIDGNTPPPDVVSCTVDGIAEIIVWGTEANLPNINKTKLQAKRLGDINSVDVQFAYDQFNAAVTSYDQAVATYGAKKK